MSTIVIGIDGGGSKTHAIVADETGSTIGEAFGPGSALKPGEEEASAEVIAGVVREALEAAGMSNVTPRVICVGVAGAGRENPRQALWQALVARDLAGDVVVHSDFGIALDDAFGDGPGVLLIAGTGSAAFGRSPAGTTARCGGWGPVIGDEGSGTWIGRRALSIVSAAADGRESQTALTGAILTAAEVNEVADLIPWAASASREQIASLAPVVFSVADGGDLRANALISLAVEELMLHIRALGQQLFGDERAAIPVALSGGLMRKGTTLRKRLEHRLRAAVPGAQIKPGEINAARGAVRGALRFAGAEVG
ncbi:MAG TPA: BadF/BadG/BcrA/BcrD ATPase family protein [Gemmatimonadaceae bacterium]|nr:BadF/BadG/BcrA/BcrD ATPase family protein [Gemmatimonadaceae bacterium]